MATIKLSTLRDAKRLSGARLEACIRDLIPELSPRVKQLRAVVGTSGLFVIPKGKTFDRKLVSTALLSIVVADVNLYDPYSRKRQTREIQKACRGLGVRYEDVLRLAENGPRIHAALRLRE